MKKCWRVRVGSLRNRPLSRKPVCGPHHPTHTAGSKKVVMVRKLESLEAGVIVQQ